MSRQCSRGPISCSTVPRPRKCHRTAFAPAWSGRSGRHCCPKPGHIGRIGQRCGVEQDTLQEFDAALALGFGQHVWVSSGGPEGRFVVGETVRLQLDALATGISTQEDEVPVVGDQYLAIRLQIPGDLGTPGGLPGIVTRPLSLHDTSRWQLRVQIRLARAWELVGSEEATVRNASAL